jgi:hypothetical protein
MVDCLERARVVLLELNAPVNKLGNVLVHVC